MPYIGLSSFLHICSKLVTHYLIRRFNALPRAFFFSTNITEESKSELMTFQCPTSGFLLFYKYVEPNMYHIVSSVSMPYLGLSSFLRWQEMEENMNQEMFQCPTSGFLLFYAMSLHPLNLLALQIRFCV